MGNRIWVGTVFIPSSSSKGWWGNVPMWLQCTCFHRGVLPWRFHGDSVLPRYTDCTALWGKGEKQQKSGLCMEQLARRWWSLPQSFMLLWTRLSESFSPGDHVYSYKSFIFAVPVCGPQSCNTEPAYFISLGAGLVLWKGDTENRGLSWCHRCKRESLPVANLKFLVEISCC